MFFTTDKTLLRVGLPVGIHQPISTTHLTNHRCSLENLVSVGDRNSRVQKHTGTQEGLSQNCIFLERLLLHLHLSVRPISLYILLRCLPPPVHNPLFI